ncbi:cell wall hydrolase [Brevundimonas sp.]|uniref:cell wall hydrolase n=1 Tax=Brevundimonas sp. TaxID=1871086 RepID=UPI00286C6C4D|nr:cell wall hydrolase [Brevundimonas sp.]
MTVSRLTSDPEAPRTLTGRAVVVARRIRAWASTEAGGWTIVGVLLVCALAAACATVVLPKINAARPLLTADASLDPTSGSAPAQIIADFTLAPEAVQDISQDAARAWNAALPFSTDPVRPSAPFFAPAVDVESYSRALDCLTTAIYYEAASESAAGQAAVAQVVLNRARHPAYPRTVCGVVFQGSERTTGCQFSFTCDGAMARPPSIAGWQRARAVASAALNGHVATAVGTATHYHTDWVAPYWAARLSKVVKIGTHIFYRWTGAWGLPAAFRGVYAGAEPVVARMAALSTISFEPPAEVLDAFVPLPLSAETDLASPTLRLASRLSLLEGDDAANVTGVVEESDLPAATPEAPVGRPVVLQRDAPIMADPLASPGATPPRQRQRIAAPSGW